MQTLRHVMTIKDYITLVLSILAFIASLSTTSFRLFTEKLGFSLMVNEEISDLFIEYDLSKRELLGSLSQNLTFINYGNRPIAVTDITLWIYQSARGKSPDLDCKWNGGDSWSSGSRTTPKDGFD